MSEVKCPKCLSSSYVKSGLSAPVECLNSKRRQRLRCRLCRHRFSQNAHSLSYRQKKVDRALNSKILQLFLLGTSNRQIARAQQISEECVRRRLDRLAKRALIFHHQMMQSIRIDEPIAFDGLENFAGSQYDPNNIQQAIGAESLFVYDFNFAPLNRKGRMSNWQKVKLAKIEEQYGRYDPKSIRQQSAQIFKRIHEKAVSQRPDLWTDEHFQYKRALRRDLKQISFVHKCVSSSACRNFQNILFSVNHMDLLLRQRVAAFMRETISFAKSAGRMIQKYVLFAVYKNYMCPQFTKKHVRRPQAHEQSPAQHLGVSKKLLGFKDVFWAYPRAEQIKEMPSDWQCFFHAQVPKNCLRDKKFNKRRMA